MKYIPHLGEAVCLAGSRIPDTRLGNGVALTLALLIGTLFAPFFIVGAALWEVVRLVAWLSLGRPPHWWDGIDETFARRGLT